MPNKGLLLVAAVAVATLLYLVYLAATFEAPEGVTTVNLEAPAQRQLRDDVRDERPDGRLLPSIEPVPAEPLTPASAPPVIDEPAIEIAVNESPLIDEAVDEAVVEPVDAADELADQAEQIEPEPQLPSLNDSDGFVVQRIRELQNGMEVARLLATDQLVRRFVVTVDALSREDLPQANLPYQPLQQEMPVQTIDEERLFQMNADAQSRFDPIVDTIFAMDMEQTMGLYRILSPLFQQAYTEIGFRDVNFDDTLRKAIMNVLRLDVEAGPFQLVKPSVMYLYADTRIEALGRLQKQLIRLGPDNADRVKEKLRQFMTLL